MQAGAAAASVVGAPMGAAGTQSRSEDEESTGMKDIKRTATQAFVGGGGVVPNRRSSSRFERYPFVSAGTFLASIFPSVLTSNMNI